jgi:2-C-methyl-D-erythritol 4-phosphate cytidylyltransferase
MSIQKQHALIVAGGKGLRMGSDIPKQFMLLKHQPVLMHTITKFFYAGCAITLVLPETQVEYWESLCVKYHFTIPHQVVFGGDERFYSVKNGLAHLQDGIVAIHDGVRPCVSSEVIRQSFENAQTNGNGIACVSLKDSIRMKDGQRTKSVNRELFYLVQTPQTFSVDAIKKAYQQPYLPTFTDDASVYEHAGGEVHLSLGDYKNIKITTAEDLELAALFV